MSAPCLSPPEKILPFLWCESRAYMFQSNRAYLMTGRKIKVNQGREKEHVAINRHARQQIALFHLTISCSPDEAANGPPPTARWKTSLSAADSASCRFCPFVLCNIPTRFSCGFVPPTVTDPISLGKQKSGGKNKNKQQHRDEPKRLQPEEEYAEQRTDGPEVEQSTVEDASVVAEVAAQEVIDGPVEIRHSDVMGRSVSHQPATATRLPSCLIFILLKKTPNDSKFWRRL